MGVAGDCQYCYYEVFLIAHCGYSLCSPLLTLWYKKTFHGKPPNTLTSV